MRQLLMVVGSVLVIGCSTPLPLDNGTGATGGNGGASGQQDDLGMPGSAPDLASGQHPTGGSCTSICDCDTGLVCFNMKCMKSPVPLPLYCCDSSNCPSGSYCQSASGMFGQCGGMGTGGMGPGTGGMGNGGTGGKGTISVGH